MNTGKQAGVIVGRFQVPELHAGHKHLFDFVQERHQDMLVVLGTPDFPTPRNPLSYPMRKQMVTSAYPSATVVELRDHPSDEVWSNTLDRVVREHCGNEGAVFYASRDSFAEVYTGDYQVFQVPDLPNVSGTDCRKKIAATEDYSPEFLRGIVYAYETRLTVTRPMVDIAVIRPETREVLLAGKTTDPEDKWRFIGGLVDPNESLVTAAKREVREEASNIEIDGLTFITSLPIVDWRYRGNGEYGITTLFRAQYIFGAPRPQDDIARLKWVPYEDVMQVLINEHKPLGEQLIRSLALTEK